MDSVARWTKRPEHNQSVGFYHWLLSNYILYCEFVVYCFLKSPKGSEFHKNVMLQEGILSCAKTTVIINNQILFWLNCLPEMLLRIHYCKERHFSTIRSCNNDYDHNTITSYKNEYYFLESIEENSCFISVSKQNI